MFQAAYRHVGQERVRSSFLTYYLLVALTIVVLLDVFAGGLVLLAGPAYRSAAPLIPLIGLGFVFYGLYIVLVRTIKLEGHRMLWYALGTILAGLVDVGVSVVTIPWLGAYGAPIGTISGLLVACLLWTVVVTRLMNATFTYEARPLACLVAAVALAGSIQWVGLSVWPAGRAVVLLLVLVVYGVSLAVLGVIPRRHIRLLSRLARAAGREGIGGQDPTMGVARLDPRRRSLLAAIERDGVPTVVLAERLGRTDEEVCREYLAILRELIGLRSDPAEFDVALAGYLLSRMPEAKRDRIGKDVMEDGADGFELMELNEAALRLRALPARAWTTWVTEAPNQEHRVRLSTLAEHLAGLPASDRRAALAILRDGRTPAQAAAETGLSEHLAAARVIRVLRRVGGLGAGGPHDATIGMSLLGSGAAERRSPEARAVALVYDQVRAHTPRRWRRTGISEHL